MFFLSFVILGIAQVDQIKVRVKHDRARQIATLQTGFANVFHPSKVLVIEIVSVETSPRAVGRVGAADDSAASRTVVKMAVREVGVAQVAELQIRSRQAG